MESDAIIHIPKVHGHSGGFALLPEGTPVRLSPYPIVSLPVNRPGSRYINEAEHKTVTDYCNRVFDAEVERRKGGLENRVTHARRCCDKNLPRVGHPDGFLYVEAEPRAPRGIGKARGGRLEPHPSPTAKRMLSCENTGICVSP
ncbi:hypothetical protein APHAL10511_005480 [Amanita phalloides]|nr:hypothetical protein APHAL10511_005480 [Amanita phalloides]